jgi:hypothetical protein
MAAGNPVVAAAVPAVEEVAEGAAELVSPHDENAWAAAIDRILSTPAVAKAMRARGKAVAAERSWGKVAEDLLLFLEAVVRDFAPRPGIGSTGRPNRRTVRARLLALALVLLLAAVGIVTKATASGRKTEQLRAVPAARWLETNSILLSAQPGDLDLINMRDLIGVRAVVDLTRGSELEGLVARDLHLDFLGLEIPRGGFPDEGQLIELMTFVREHRDQKKIVLIHDEGGYDTDPVVEAMLFVCAGAQPKAVIELVGPAHLTDQQLGAVDALAIALGKKSYVPAGRHPPVTRAFAHLNPAAVSF